MRHVKQTIAALAFAAICATSLFVAFGATGGGDYSFSAPRGWTRSPGSGPFIAVWRTGTGTSNPQFVGIATYRFGASEERFKSVALKPYVERLFHNIDVGVEAPSATCGGHFARYIAARYTADDGRQAMVQEMLSVWGGKLWMVAYGRRDGQPSRADARASLASLCVLGSSAPARYATPTPSAGVRTPSPAAPASQPPGLVSTSAPTANYSTPYPTVRASSYQAPVLYSPPVNAPPTGH